MPHWSMPRVVASTRLMVRVAAEHGVATSCALAGTGLPNEALVDPAIEIDGKQELAVARNIVRALGTDVPFSLLAGERYHVTSHGAWGLALLCSPSLGHALDFSANYFELSFSFNHFDMRVEQDVVRLSYDGEHNPHDLRDFLVERDIAAAVTFGRDLFGHKIPVRSVQLRSRRPRDASAYELQFGMVPEFEAPRTCLTFAREWLERSPILADDLGLRVTEGYCRAQLERRNAHSGVAGIVRKRFLARLGDFPSMEQIALELGVTVRTLRNRLARESTSYRELLDETRLGLAEELLCSRMTLEQIALTLGYADVSAFAVAFKRWTGTSPRAYRHRVDGLRRD